MTAEQILPLLVGPYGALVLAFVVIYFLWKLYRESQQERKEDRSAIVALSEAVKQQTAEIRSWREATMQLLEKQVVRR